MLLLISIINEYKNHMSLCQIDYYVLNYVHKLNIKDQGV